MLQALLAYLLAACGEDKDAVIPAAELLSRFPSVPGEELEEHLSLLNLVNFGGGCYTIYAELVDDEVHVDKELWGDTFRLAPRLTPLEARAIRLALEYVGPMIAADAHTQLRGVRRKLEETFGQFELAQLPQPTDRARRGGSRDDARARHAREQARRDRVPEGGRRRKRRRDSSSRIRSSAQMPNWYVHTWDRTSGAERSFRLDRMRSAKLTREKFEPREGFEPTRLRGARRARILYTPAIARYEIERGARKLADGSALREIPVGSDEWLESEILSKRGEAIVLEPDELRHRLAARARELAKELGVERLRAPA